MAQQVDLSGVLASHLGVGGMARLQAFVRWMKLSLGGTTNGTSARVFVAGSAMRTKQFNDVDLYLVYEDEEYEKRYKAGYDGQNPLWWFHCAAFGALAREQTGLPIDFHICNVTAMTSLGTKLEFL